MEILVITTIAILFFISYYINIKFLGNEEWYRNLNFLFSFVFINSCIIFVGEIYGINYSLKIGFVFCLFYGPFLYLLLISSKSLGSKMITQRNYFTHFYMPFLVLVSYIVMYSIFVDKGDYDSIAYLNCFLYLFCSLIGLGYGSFGYYFLIKNEISKLERNFLFLYIILIYVNSVFFISFLFAQEVVINDNTYYLLINLLLSILLFFTSKKQFTCKFKREIVYEEIQEDTLNNDDVVPLFIKSEKVSLENPVSEIEIENYREIISKELIDSKLFLDSNLTLSTLSSKTNISKTHLTYYFKQSSANGFYDYINRIRVENSITILKESVKTITLDEWAEASGFNSRVAFYRAFIKVKGFSPSELIQSLRIVE